jgi:hypothetical protein
MTVAVQISKGKDFNDGKNKSLYTFKHQFHHRMVRRLYRVENFLLAASSISNIFHGCILYVFLHGWDGATLGGIFHLAL